MPRAEAVTVNAGARPRLINRWLQRFGAPYRAELRITATGCVADGERRAQARIARCGKRRRAQPIVDGVDHAVAKVRQWWRRGGRP